MATVVCQGLLPSSFFDPPEKAEQPSFPPQLVTLRLKLSPPKPADLGGWGSLLQHSLSSTNGSPQDSATAVGGKDAYAPPPARQPSSLKLSHRSLQLCTENLGSETGTEVSEGDSIFSSVGIFEFPIKSPTSPPTRQPSRGRLVNPPREIPPPLTTLRGAEALQVRARREEGRLVINAVKSPSKGHGFQAERASGRLRLSLLRANGPDTDTPNPRDRETADGSPQSDQFEGEHQHDPIEKCRRIGNGEEEHSYVSTESILFREGYLQDRDGEIMTGKLVRKPTVKIRCNERDHDHCHHHHHHQSNMFNWEREPVRVEKDLHGM